MLLNDAKGSYGMYSRAGWMTTETFHLLRRKDEILSGNPTRILIKGNFIPDDPLKVNS